MLEASPSWEGFSHSGHSSLLTRPLGAAPLQTIPKISKVFSHLHAGANLWRRTCFVSIAHGDGNIRAQAEEQEMVDLTDIKITERDEQVLNLLIQGCSNKEIAEQLNISPRTVKQHLRTLFLRAGITNGRKRVKLATAMYQKEQREVCNHVIA
jgi:DNA-binding NarL/FixJ family response regulator